MQIPTAHSTDSLERFLLHAQNAPQPKIVDRAYLRQSGFTSGNDPELRHIFRLLGFLNEKDEPQERWTLYRESGKGVLRNAIYECYKGLFELFPDGPSSRTDTELALWFRPPITGDTRSSIERAIRTFRKLCQFAGITAENSKKENPSSGPSQINTMALGSIDTYHNVKNPQLILNLPSFTEKEDYLPLFKALKEVFYE